MRGRALALLLLLLSTARGAPPFSSSAPARARSPPLRLRWACATPGAHARAAAAARSQYPQQHILSYEETCLLRRGWRSARTAGAGAGAGPGGARAGAGTPAPAQAVALLARALRWRRVLLLPPPARCHSPAALVARALLAAGLAVAWHTADDPPLRPDAVVVFVCEADSAPAESVTALAGVAGAAGAVPLLLLLRDADMGSPQEEQELDSLLPRDGGREENSSLIPEEEWSGSLWNESTAGGGAGGEAAWRALGPAPALRGRALLAAGERGGLGLYEARWEGGWRRAGELRVRGGVVRLRGTGGLQAHAGVADAGGGEAGMPLLLLPLASLLALATAALACRAWRRRRRVRGCVLLPAEHVQFAAPAAGAGAGVGAGEQARRVPEGMESMLSCWLQQLHEFGGPPLQTAAAAGGRGGEGGARYRGEPVLLRPLPPPPAPAPALAPLELRARATDVLLVMQGLHHENLNAFIGCLGGPRPALVWASGARGTLEDVLVADDIRLDWAFRLSLLTDLVRGARRLHASPLRAHGRLSSRACVVDARWVLRITDYGTPAFYRAQGLPEPPRSARDLLWTAPELLRELHTAESAAAGLAGGGTQVGGGTQAGGGPQAGGGTQAGDVFSFAIIMQEVIVRGEPYCMLPLAPEEIVEKLCRPPPLIRPSVSMGAAPPEAVSVMRQCWSELPDLRPDFASLLDIFRHLHRGRYVMRQCWSELPDLRPDFASLLDIFRHLHRGRKINIVDSMFEMLEKYSNNLELLVRERTDQLDMEKRKTEQLLNRMLPRQVAERLLLGSPVEPEEFADVSVYFSDIVGFTALAAASTPVQVVDLLNELYTRFDAVIERHGVYKVETIGDAYMVVGGLPARCSTHAARVGTVALLLQAEAARVRVRHLAPPRPLLLRAGMHTGAVCAGVVGRTMPRYCLFGDTVNTAARMESTGAARRVQVSAASARRLQAAGGFRLRSRGLTHVKGKGRMHTYWLLGKDGLDLPDLPDAPDAPDAEPESPRHAVSPIPTASAPASPGHATPPLLKPNKLTWQRAGTQSADNSPEHTATPAPPAPPVTSAPSATSTPPATSDPSAPYARYRCGAGAGGAGGARVLRRQWSLERAEPPPAPHALPPSPARYRTRAEY